MSTPPLYRRFCIAFCGLLLGAVAAAAEAEIEFRVEMIDGTAQTGGLQGLDKNRVVLTRGPQPIPLERVLRIDRQGVAEAPRLRGGVVRLVDGGRLPHSSVGFDGERFRFFLPTPFAIEGEAPLQVAAAAVRSIRLGPPQRHEQAWNRLVSEPADSDLLVVYRDHGRAIRGVPCVVRSVDEGEAVVQLDGERIAVPLARVYGLVLASGKEGKTAETAGAVVEGAFGRLIAAEVALSANGLRVEAGLGSSLLLPLDLVGKIDFSAGRVRWLGELPLVSHTWQPAFGFPAGLGAEGRPPGLVVDHAFDGGPLRIADLKTLPRPGSVQEFERGVALRSAGEAVYELPPGFPRFCAVAGIDPKTARQGSVVLRLLADDRLVYEHVVDGSGAVPVVADLGDARTLRVVVDYGDNLDRGDRLHLGSARVTK